MQNQRGITLTIAFFVMTLMLVVILSISTIIFDEIQVSSNIGSSVNSFYAAETGVEKALYYDVKQGLTGATRGICNICTVCSASECLACTTTNLSTIANVNGCDPLSCNNCQITFTGNFNNATFSVDAKVTPSFGESQQAPMSAVAYGTIGGSGLFVAVSSAGFAMTSPDGIFWTTRITPVGTWNAVAYGTVNGQGMFVAVANSGTPRVMTSTDGVNWIGQNAPDAEWGAIAYGNGIFVVGSGEFYQLHIGKVMISSDGINWDLVTDLENKFNGIVFGNGEFVASLTDGSYSSFDGVNWVPGNNNTGQGSPLYHDIFDITYGNGLYVMIGHDGPPDYKDWFITSPDGVNWTEHQETIVTIPRTVTFGGGKFVATGFGGGAYSVDGINWLPSNIPSPGYWVGAIYGDGTYVAVPDNDYWQSDQYVIYSNDAVNWNTSGAGGTTKLTVDSKGYFNNTTRAVELNYTK